MLSLGHWRLTWKFLSQNTKTLYVFYKFHSSYFSISRVYIPTHSELWWFIVCFSCLCFHAKKRCNVSLWSIFHIFHISNGVKEKVLWTFQKFYLFIYKFYNSHCMEFIEASLSLNNSHSQPTFLNNNLQLSSYLVKKSMYEIFCILLW